MAGITRQNSLLVNQDWTKIYESFRNADFQSYDFQTLRKAMIDYIKVYYPENFNDYIESSEYIALIDLIAFLGQSLAFRTDLNARENFIDTAERRDSVLKLARLISYNPKRNQTATGFIKFDSVQTTERLKDSNGIDLTNLIVKWNDATNLNWYEQFITILNSCLPRNQQVGKPANSKNINGVLNAEYNVNLPSNALPVIPFSTLVDGSALQFEAVSGTSIDTDYIYEASPGPGVPLNIIYKNDNLGNSSNNTGFFFYFKQGALQNQEFAFNESIPNNLAAVNVDNINNTDVWLYQINNFGVIVDEWEKIPAVVGTNIIYNNNAAKKSFQVNSRAGDQIDLVFGDGTFAEIPVGSFRTYFRSSVGLSYTITPDEMSNITLNIPYISKSGRLETLTVVASLKYTVANAIARESITEIKTKAPQLYYSQNRMINGEDYNTFPYSNYSSISKVKAVNRTSSGVSRFLDVLDTTGKYSSTNIFAEDGIVYKEDILSSFTFTFNTTSEINRVIENQVLPLVRGKPILHYYYENFTRFNLNLSWNRTTVGSNSSTGYFGNQVSVGTGVAPPNNYITEGSVVIFSPGDGKYFNSANEIVSLPSSGLVPQNGQLLLYATVVKLVGSGNQGVLSNGQGPITLSENIPTAATAINVFPAYNNSFTRDFKIKLINNIQNYLNFGLRYDQNTKLWEVIDSVDLNLTAPFSLEFQGDTTGQLKDSSWLLAFSVNSATYTVQARGINFVFESVRETKFYFENQNKIYDPVTGFTVNDSVNVLRINGNANTGQPLPENYLWFVYDQVVESDGYVDARKVLITYSDQNDNGVPDDPDIFQNLVMPIKNVINSSTLWTTANGARVYTQYVKLFQNGQIFYDSTAQLYYELSTVPSISITTVDSTQLNRKFVFFESVSGYNNFVTYVPVAPGVINVTFDIRSTIVANINNYEVGQVFYAWKDQQFYEIAQSGSSKSLITVTNYFVRTGRESLYFQYKHNAPGSRRIDPSPSNLIDLYILTKEYENSYRAWAIDTTGTLQEPEKETPETLKLAFGDLENYKALSDALIYNPAKFKPLFGSKAIPELQATFKVVKNSNINLTDSEIRSQVLAYINAFFALGNWDFGETFYFTELATYIQQGLAPNISSILIIPNSTNQVYGSLQQISSEPNEILISAATMENIEVIPAITASLLNLQTNSVNTIIT
jgi:hypothetical protein